jgi:hypothetical protein
MLEIDTHNTCGPARAEKRHLPFGMRSFAALSSVGSAARESAREEVAAPHGNGPPARSIRRKALPVAASCNNRLCRGLPIVAHAANLQLRLSFRLKCRLARGRLALLERPRPTLGPEKPISHPQLLHPAGPVGRRGRAVIPEGSMFPF